MATTFGTRPEDVVTDRQGNVLSGVALELYGTRTDATGRLSKLSTVFTDTVGGWLYTDAVNRATVYVRDPNGRIWSVDAEEASAAAPIAGLAALPPGATFTIYWDGSSWTYNGAPIGSRPSARTDLTMLAVGGTVGPSFGQVGVDLWLRDGA